MPFEVVLLIAALAGAALAALVVWLLSRQREALAEARGRAAADVERAQLAARLAALEAEALDLRSRLTSAEGLRDALQTELRAQQTERAQFEERAQAAAARVLELERGTAAFVEKIEALQQRLGVQTAENSGLREELAAERRQAQEKLATLQQARQELSDQFKTLANDILDEKSRKFAEQNQLNLGQLLNPLKEQLTAFKSKVEEVYVNEGKDRSAMAEQVRQLMQLNQTLSQDANNLALAIRGDRKAQGNWGEIILDDVLERAGLVRGTHYERQGGLKAEDGLANVIPDVVIRLPGDRQLVVDSKLTLPDYRAFADADTEEEKAAAMKRHLASIRNHIKGLSEKNYQSLYELKSLDFVVMFVPLEPAFMLAVTHDRELFQQAWDRNVLLVSPSTLLFVVRTVAYLWRQEGLSRNAKEISTRGAELYDKLVGFMVDLDDVGRRLQQAQDSFQGARRKLSEGKGNVIRQAELLRQLGVKPSKSLPAELTQIAMDGVAEDTSKSDY